MTSIKLIRKRSICKKYILLVD